MKEKPLAPGLFKALANICGGRVKISRRGERASGRAPARKSMLRSFSVGAGLKITGGERYVCDCPVCGRKEKLYVSYLVEGTPLLEVLDGWGFINCFRCGFQKDRDKLQPFLNTLAVVGSSELPDLEFDDPVSRKVERDPPFMVPLDDPTCPPVVRDYLEARRFDPLALSRDWGVAYSRDPRWFQVSRLVVPIVAQGGQVGWQARHMDTFDTEFENKYWFPPGFTKASWVFNQDKAARTAVDTGTVFVCEGVFDVFRVGFDAIALFGKKASETQGRIIRNLFPRRKVVVLLDNEPEAVASSEELVYNLLSSGVEAVSRHFKDGDPADHTTEECRRMAK